jgi:glycosyltransferase involved in cell wall biosynthesis
MFRPAALIPAYRCEATIGAVVEGFRAHLPEVLVVDDGSDDETAPRARRAGARVLERERNGGKGAAIRDGLELLLAGEVTHVLLADGDGQHDPADAPKLLEAGRAGADFVIGSRMAEPSAMPSYRYWTNFIGSQILSKMTGHRIEDGQSGYRLVSRRALDGLELKSRGYLIETEMLIKTAARVREFVQVPVRVIYGGPSHYRPFRDTWIISWGAVYYKVFESDGGL